MHSPANFDKFDMPNFDKLDMSMPDIQHRRRRLQQRPFSLAFSTRLRQMLRLFCNTDPEAFAKKKEDYKEIALGPGQRILQSSANSAEVQYNFSLSAAEKGKERRAKVELARDKRRNNYIIPATSG